MNINDLLVKGLQANIGLLKSTLADFSDADFLARPVPNANHTNWQLGHLIKSETGMISAVGAKMPPLSPDFEASYTKETASSDDAAKFVSREQLLTQFEKTRNATIAFAKSLTAEQLSASGPEKYRDWAPTVADAIAMMSAHVTMHMGQFQVIRRKLNKPILF